LLPIAAWLSLAALPVVACPPALAASQSVTNADLLFDDQKGPNQNFERAHLQPLELSADGTRLYAINSAGARLTVFDVASGQRVLDIPVGIGAVSVARRPGGDQLWVVDEIASSVFVVQPSTASVVRTIRVGGQPHGIAFTPEGDRAYVTCSGVTRVDVIDCAAMEVVHSIELPVRQPRGIVWADGHAWVIPLLSGNNSAPRGQPNKPDHIVGVNKITGAGLVPLPDRDLLAIATMPEPEQDHYVPALTRKALGTVLFSLTRRPGTSELWIPNTEALNTKFKGQANYVAGQVVSNRIAVVDLNGGTPVIHDLEALTPSDQRLAQPSHVGFDASGSRAYVSGYGTDLIGVFDVLPGGGLSWVGSISLPSELEYPQGAGPRQVLIDPSGTWLFSFNRIDNALTRVALADLPASGPFTFTADKPASLGLNTMSDEEQEGRFLFSNARFSKSMTSSCGSCHIDGHTDGLAWDLSAFLDPEGTPSNQLAYPFDFKGPMVTQSVRRLQETGPYHWRGERKSLLEFNQTFADLLENQVNGEPGPIESIAYLRHYINNLRWPPNPYAPLDRKYTSKQLAGADVFLNKPVFKGLTCAECHQFPLGTSGEIAAGVVDGVTESMDIPSLRGVADKLSAPHFIGGPYGTRSELGAGFTHGGALATLGDVLTRDDPAKPGTPLFDLTPLEVEQLEAFLKAFDWGIAPAAGYAATAWTGNLATFAETELAFLQEQAELGNCDLVYQRVPHALPNGQGVAYLSGMYNPQTGKYIQSSSWGSELSQDEVLSDVVQGRPVTFLGLPLGMGRSVGLDRDMDELFDLDEIREGTDAEVFDSDGDTFPDGWEVERGMDPTVPQSSAPDQTAPSLVGPVRVLWATTNTVKFELDTDEMSRVLVAYDGGYPVQRLPLGPPVYATHHDVVLDGLEPGRTYSLELELQDPADNKRLDVSTSLQTRPLVLGEPARVHSIALSASSGELTSTVILKAGKTPVGAGYEVEGAVYRIYLTGGLEMVSKSATALTNAYGVARVKVPLPPPGAPSTLLFVLQGVSSPSGKPGYVEAKNALFSVGLAY
jgi:YVTN family beta-propeller protein